jgi:general secretion pathway protein G
MKTVVRRYVTLIEMMIVMFLIALIIGVVAYNYQGTLAEGKAFKTKAGKEKLETILNLVVSENSDAEDDIEVRWVDYVKASPLVQNPDALIKDGWGQKYEVKYEDGKIKVASKRYEEYKKSNPATMFNDNSQQE